MVPGLPNERISINTILLIMMLRKADSSALNHANWISSGNKVLVVGMSTLISILAFSIAIIVKKNAVNE
jgi:hypothetical protein